MRELRMRISPFSFLHISRLVSKLSEKLDSEKQHRSIPDEVEIGIYYRKYTVVSENVVEKTLHQRKKHYMEYIVEVLKKESLAYTNHRKNGKARSLLARFLNCGFFPCYLGFNQLII